MKKNSAFFRVLDNNKILFLLLLIMFCIFAICIAYYAQYYYRYSETDAFMLGINVQNQKLEEEYTEMKNHFNELFVNGMKTNGNSSNISKFDDSKELVYTSYNNKSEKIDYYTVDIEIPYINMKSQIVDNINEEINTLFYNKAKEVLSQEVMKVIYNVNYVAYVNQDVLSLVIKATLKEGTNSERIIIKTYNYSMLEDRLLSLNEIINLKKVKVNEIQKRIDSEIIKEYTNAKELEEIGYNVYKRDINSDMYKIENTDTFFLTEEGYVYIIYAYGNKEHTNEKDIIIF